MPDRDQDAFLPRVLGVLSAAVLVLLVLTAGWAAYRHLFFDRTPAFRTSDELLRAVRAGPLTAADRRTALTLWHSRESAVATRVNGVILLAAERNPDWRPELVAHFTRLADTPDPAANHTRARFLLAQLAKLRPAADSPSPAAGRITPDTPTPPTGPPR